jgi:hypothetical protein
MRRTFGAVVALTLASAVSGLTLRSDARAPEADSAVEWAGAFSLDPVNGTGSLHLSISTDSRFRLTSAGCFGTSEIARGGVAYHDGLLHLKPGPTFQDQLPSGAKVLIPVRHDGRLFLVTSDRAAAFLNAMFTGRVNCYEEGCESFFVRDSDVVLTNFRVAPFFSTQTAPGTR